MRAMTTMVVAVGRTFACEHAQACYGASCLWQVLSDSGLVVLLQATDKVRKKV